MKSNLPCMHSAPPTIDKASFVAVLFPELGEPTTTVTAMLSTQSYLWNTFWLLFSISADWLQCYGSGNYLDKEN